MKIKLLKTIGIIGCLGIVGATPVMLTSCKKKSTSQSATVTPQLKKSISGIGSLDEFITTSSKADDVNENFENILNMNKQSVIDNWENISESEKDNINLNTTLIGWDNSSWGASTFDDWNSSNSPTLISWKGYKTDANDKDKVDFKTNKELKEFLNTNITQIAKNAIGEIGSKKASLADADIKVDENGNLLVGITVIEEQLVTHNSRTKRDVDQNTNYTLSIPSSVINFNPTINLIASYGSNQSISSDVSFTYTLTDSNVIEQTFDTSVAALKNTIFLEEKTVSENDNIGLWKTVTDVGILKALGWLENSSELEDHKDGDGIDAGLLKEDVIISDLNISGLTKEKLLGIEIEMKQRDVTNPNYNGEYAILVSTTINSNSEVDLDLNFNTYKIIASKSNEKQLQQLQVNVPNAYIIDTTLEGKKFMNISKDFFTTSFEMGWKNTDNSSNATQLLQKNLENDKIFNKFIEKIDESSKSKKIDLYNGVIISYKSNQWSGSQDADYKNTITLKVTLKKGFSFKKSFTNGNYKYNIDEKTSEVTFGISLGNTSGEAAIWKNSARTVEDVANSLN